MSIKVMTQVWGTDFPANDKLLLLALADFGDDEGRHIFPSIETLARKVSSHRRTVERRLKELREDELPVLIREKRASQHRPTEYRLDLDVIQTRQIAAPEEEIQTRQIAAPEESRPGNPSAQTRRSVRPDAAPVSHDQLENHQEPSSSSGEPDVQRVLKAQIRGILVAALGYEPTTQGASIQWNKAIKSLVEAGATPAEVQRRIGLYREHWPKLTLSPKALDQNWDALGTLAEKKQTKNDPDEPSTYLPEL